MRAFVVVPSVACLGFALTYAPATARAEQIVLFDLPYTHTGANDAHHGISGAGLNQPNNWTAPIDYAQGTIHFYQEVLTKPSDKDTIIDFCLISARGYGCIETFIYKTTGVFNTTRSMAGRDVDQRARIDFTQKMRSIQMVLKTPAPTYINGGRPQSDFLPSKMRFVATLVSPGGTYVPPVPTAGLPFDAGVAPDASVADAGVTADVSVAPLDAPVVSEVATPASGGTSPPAGTGGTSPPSSTPPKSGSGGTPASAPMAPSGENTPASGNSVNGGCSVGGNGAGPGGPGVAVPWLLLAGLSFWRARRWRARRR